MLLHRDESRLPENVQMPAGRGLGNGKRFGNKRHAHAELHRVSRPLLAEVLFGVRQQLKDSQSLLAGHRLDLY